jgi:hypothetical protein
MNIVIISDFNIAGQCTFLMRAINKYTNHNARCIIAYDDHFQYDRDIILTKFDPDAPQPMKWSEGNVEEANEVIAKADFFHFGRGVFNWSGANFNKILNKRNCVVKYYGSELREDFQGITDFHRRTGFAAITGTDWTITGRLGFPSFYHLGSYFTAFGDLEPSEIPQCESPVNSPTLKICAGSAGNPIKGYDYLVETIRNLKENEYRIELDIISGLDNKAALERKRQSHVCFTSLHGGWGISGIEAMFMGMPVLACIDPFVESLYPDHPTIRISKEFLMERLMALTLMNKGVLQGIGQQSREFTLKHFKHRDIVTRYMSVIDLIMNGGKYLEGGHLPDPEFMI